MSAHILAHLYIASQHKKHKLLMFLNGKLINISFFLKRYTIVDKSCLGFLADCYVCDDCQGAGTLSTCTGSTPYCLNHYSNSQWGVSHVTKR